MLEVMVVVVVVDMYGQRARLSATSLGGTQAVLFDHYHVHTLNAVT